MIYQLFFFDFAGLWRIEFGPLCLHAVGRLHAVGSGSCRLRLCSLVECGPLLSSGTRNIRVLWGICCVCKCGGGAGCLVDIARNG